MVGGKRGAGKGKDKATGTDEDRTRPTMSNRQRKVKARTRDIEDPTELVVPGRREFPPGYFPERGVDTDTESDQEQESDEEMDDSSPDTLADRPTIGGKGPMVDELRPSVQVPLHFLADDEMEEESEEEHVRPTSRTVRPARRVGASSSSSGVGVTKRRMRVDDSWRLKNGLDGGPKNPELLYGFLGHVAHEIWNGQDRGLLQGVHKWNVLNQWGPNSLDEDVRELVTLTGLGYLYDATHRNIDMGLISAFVERWHPETNSFHMPFGEMTVTMHDVHFLLRIPVDGRPVVLSDGAAKQVLTTADDFLGFDSGARRGGGVKLTTIKESVLVGSQDAHRVATGYIWWLLGNTIFVDKTKNSVPAYYLSFLRQVPQIANYSWGSAALAYLYRQLGIASRAETGAICGCLSLLQAWIYAYFPMFEPKENPKWTSQQPWACKWIPSYVTPTDDALIRYRRQLDGLHEKDVNWMPFQLMPENEKKISLFKGIIYCRNITEPYMPERVLRQFGYVQMIPPPPFPPASVSWTAITKSYVREHFGNPTMFLRALFDVIHPEGFTTRSSPRLTCADSYMQWFSERTHPRVDRDMRSQHEVVSLDLCEKTAHMLQRFHPLLTSLPYNAYDNQQMTEELCLMWEAWMPDVKEKRREMGDE